MEFPPNPPNYRNLGNERENFYFSQNNFCGQSFFLLYANFRFIKFQIFFKKVSFKSRATVIGNIRGTDTNLSKNSSKKITEVSFKIGTTVIGRIRGVDKTLSERTVLHMKAEEIVNADSWNTENDMDLVGILLTISAITKRLAKLLLDSPQQNNGGNQR